MAIPTEPPAWLKAIGERLQSLPEEIAQTASELQSVSLEIEAHEDDLKEREYELLEEVTLELDPASSKPRYSNAELRAGEVKKRMKTDATAVATMEHLKTLRDRRGQLRVTGEKLSHHLSATKARADLLSGWMRSGS